MLALMASLQLDSTLVLCMIFLVSCIFLVVTSLRKDGGAVRGRAPPSPLALPIIGNLHQLGRGHHHRKLQALARRHGPLFLLRLGSVPTLVVSSPSLADAVLRTQDHVFCSRPQPHTALGTLYGCRDIAFGPYGERWRQLRRIAVVHLLSAKRVDSFRSLREEEAVCFVERIRAASAREEGGGVVNVTELIISLTNTVVSRAAFGNRLGGLEPGMVRDIMKDLTELLGTVAVSDVFPRLRWVDWATGLDARVKRTAAQLDGIVERTLAEHEASRGNDDHSEVLYARGALRPSARSASVFVASPVSWASRYFCFVVSPPARGVSPTDVRPRQGRPPSRGQGRVRPVSPVSALCRW